MKAAVIAMFMVGGVLTTQKNSMQETVVLLHGIGRTSLYMYAIELSLRRKNYAVLNITYPSRKKDIETLTDFLHEKLDREDVWKKQGKVSFVTHSMGGIVTKRYLEKYRKNIPADKMGRVVMIAPPSSGSEVADFLKNFQPYRWFFGPAGQELTTENLEKNETKPWYDLGIIAGTRRWPYPAAKFIIPGESDGLVSVARAKTPGMKDFVTVKASHGGISWRLDVHKEIVKFLKDGKFDHET